jgi:hypothetical protein
VAALHRRTYGTAIYVKQDIKDVEIINSHITDDNIHITSIKVASLHIVNIYKPPGSTWSGSRLPILNHPCLYIGDFNSHHQDWGYEQNDANGDFLHDWITNNNLSLLFDAKDRGTFVSAKWRKEYSPDLSITSTDSAKLFPKTTRSVFNNFPHSQHRTVMVDWGLKIPIVHTIQKPRWNFKKAN